MKASPLFGLLLAGITAGCAADRPKTQIRMVSVTELTSAEDTATRAPTNAVRAVTCDRDQDGIYSMFVPWPGPKRVQDVGAPGSAVTLEGDLLRLGPFPPDARKYFQVTSDRGYSMVLSERHLPLENVHNARDLGGLVTADGRYVAYGRLLRSDNPGLATTRDMLYLKSVPIDRVVDFRDPSEKMPGEEGFAQTFEWISLSVPAPLLYDSAGLKALTPAKAREAMMQIYRDYPTKYQSTFRTAFSYAEEGRPILFHDSTGKDRTGFFTMLLLSALGVEESAIRRDYLDSREHMAAFREQLIASLVPQGLSPQTLGPLVDADEAYLEASLAVIRTRYDGIDNYLRNVLNVDVDGLRRNYLRN